MGGLGLLASLGVEGLYERVGAHRCLPTHMKFPVRMSSSSPPATPEVKADVLSSLSVRCWLSNAVHDSVRLLKFGDRVDLVGG